MKPAKITRRALLAMHVPWPIAAIGGVVVVGYRIARKRRRRSDRVWARVSEGQR